MSAPCRHGWGWSLCAQRAQQFLWREPIHDREQIADPAGHASGAEGVHYDGGGPAKGDRSGLVANTFGLQAAFYTSQPLFTPEDESSSLLLTPNQGALNVFGQAYARAQIVDQEFRVGRQLVDTPLVNPQDNRLVPNTFDGITLGTLPDKDRNYGCAVGYLTAIKRRDSNTFETMSDALAGGDVADRGTAFGVLRYRPTSQLSTVFMDYYPPDFVNTGSRRPNTISAEQETGRIGCSARI